MLNKDYVWFENGIEYSGDEALNIIDNKYDKLLAISKDVNELIVQLIELNQIQSTDNKLNDLLELGENISNIQIILEMFLENLSFYTLWDSYL